MPRLLLPYILTLAILLFVTGLYGALSRTDGSGVAAGVYLMLSGACVAALGFVAFSPAYFARSWMGYGIIALALFGMMRSGMMIAGRTGRGW